MGDADDILLDDWTVVEDFGDVVAGGSDQLYAALEGLVVGSGADEGGEKRMVNVDDALGIAVDEVVRKNLHVAGEDEEISFVRLDQRMNVFLGLPLILFGDGDDRVGNLVEVGDGLVVGMVRDDQWNVAGEFAALVTVEEIDEAVVVLSRPG